MKITSKTFGRKKKMFKFKPENPKGINIKEFIMDRVKDSILTIDDDSLTPIGHPYHGMYTSGTGDKMLLYYKFTIKGESFTRRFTGEMSGNFSVTKTTIGGQTYIVRYN